MEPYLAEIRMFGGNFAPRSWALCEGQILSIAQNQSLFSLLGTMYGGDGRTTFALPDLRGRMPIGVGSGAGLPTYTQGQRTGEDTNTLTLQTMPSHTHNAIVSVADGDGDAFGAKDNYLATRAIDADVTPNTSIEVYKSAVGATFANNATLAGAVVNNTGSGQAISNMSPYIGINYIICTQGLFPSRN